MHDSNQGQSWDCEPDSRGRGHNSGNRITQRLLLRMVPLGCIVFAGEFLFAFKMRVLILACSARKRAAERLMPAIERHGLTLISEVPQVS